MHARLSGAGVPPLSLLFVCLLTLSSPGTAGAESPIPMPTDPSLTSELPSELPSQDGLQPPAQEPDYILDEEDRTAAAESEAAEAPAAGASEPST